MPYTIPSFITENDLAATNAHVVLRRLTYFAGSGKDRAVYTVHKNAAAFTANKERSIGQIDVDFSIVLGGGSFIAQANTALLLMPVMAGAILV